MASQRRPAQTTILNANRHSDALRASVLDVALQLGIGTSRTVENWMFNSVDEDEEDEEEVSMTCTGGTSGTNVASKRQMLSRP